MSPPRKLKEIKLKNCPLGQLEASKVGCASEDPERGTLQIVVTLVSLTVKRYLNLMLVIPSGSKA